MKNRDKYTIIGAVIMTLIAVLGVTYAYFTASITGRETTSTIIMTGGTMSIVYDNLSNIIEIENIYPKEEAWITKNFTVTGTNTTNLTMKYKVGLDITTNTFLAEYLTYTLENTSSDSGSPIEDIDDGVIPNSGTTWFGEGSFVTGSNQEHAYTLKIYFPDKGENQNNAQNASLVARVTIEEDGTADPNSGPDWWKNAANGTLAALLKAGNPDTPKTCQDLDTQIGTISTTDEGLKCTQDDYGTTYYYRGAVENNYLEFAGMCWRIVRITGDGSAKLVLYNYNANGVLNPCDDTYDGKTNAFARDTYDEYTTPFNDAALDNAYIGAMFGALNASTYEATHENLHDSTILTKLKEWYDNNFTSTDVSKLADVIWCNDKRVSTGTGVGTETTDYLGIKLNLKCGNNADDNKISKYTASDTINGNGKLKGVDGVGNSEYRIGLLTADEYIFSGIPKDQTYSATGYVEDLSLPYILKNSATGGSTPQWSSAQYEWTYTPGSYNYDASLWTLYNQYESGSQTMSVSMAQTWPRDNSALRPAVALKGNVQITGSGTQYDPYVVQ